MNGIALWVLLLIKPCCGVEAAVYETRYDCLEAEVYFMQHYTDKDAMSFCRKVLIQPYSGGSNE